MSVEDGRRVQAGVRKRWTHHSRHDRVASPHRSEWLQESAPASAGSPREMSTTRLISLDGSVGEGGGQILRTALSLSLLTGQGFRIAQIRANRDRPGLRPQHLAAVEAAGKLAQADITGASVGSRSLIFRPDAYVPQDLSIDVGTAGSTALILHTLHLPLALRTDEAIRLTLNGGTFNMAAPSFPFLDATWRAHLRAIGAPIALSMPRAGFYPKGGGELSAWIEPANLKPLIAIDRGPLVRVRGIAGVANLRPDIAVRMRDRAEARLADFGIRAEIELSKWESPGQGAAIGLIAEYEGCVPATFSGLGEIGKPAEAVADDAVDELLAFEASKGAAVDPHSADQILLPLALTPGRSEYTVSEVTDHLRTNAETIKAFLLERSITVEEAEGDRPGRVIIA
ncbi:RNA 3'-terminal phosphate cyclase [Singulisphaera sp. PoT]|uniref:RNA 3'-terminal phosphate cyclase n=1 Tax=Singulisphaera sp. PoT TaxID=3411797 RepID=UPI003BF4FCC9